MPHSAAPGDVAVIAALAESLGFSSLWVPENCFLNGGVAAVGAALAATQHLPIGLGVMPAPLRHPASAAMEIATLAQAHPGRFTAGFGLGVPAWLDQMGLRPRRSLQYLGDYVVVVRRLLAGEAVTLDCGASEMVLRNIRLTHPPGVVPIALGVVGPKMLELAGRVADTVILSTLAGPSYVRAAVETIGAAAAAAGRGMPRVTCFAAFHLGATTELAQKSIRSDLAFSLRASGPGPLTDAVGASEQLSELLAVHQGDSLAAAIPDEWVDEMSITGDLDACANKIGALWANGADEVVIAPKPVTDARAMLHDAAERLLPLLRPGTRT
ncbi:MAG: LLM class flavin-dependent oxidoreductase [Acidimicrobiia bacterium]